MQISRWFSGGKAKCVAINTHTICVFLIATFVLIPNQCCPQTVGNDVTIRINFDQPDGQLSAIWNFFGYDEPNYTYAANGRKLLSELAALDPAPVYIRVHNLLTTGDGAGSLKWGSTNVYTEDESGNPVYSWEILDRIFDTFRETGVKPIVEIGFMPKALSTHPEPYRHQFPLVPVNEIYTGWAYPPKDYRKWADVVFHFVCHLRERYGDPEVRSWFWEVWNEPDIDYWQGTPEEFFKLYDYTVDAVLRAYPAAKIGGPDTTGPSSAKAAEFLRAFLDHCAHGKNYVNGKIGAHLDFVSFHAKGAPSWQSDHVEMGISRQLSAIEQGFKVIQSFPQWQHIPVLLGESDPEGCAACSAKTNPQNSYRNGPLYGVYTVETLYNILNLVREHDMNFIGAVTWAFEFEDQPYFAGFRELATNGLDKPVLNAFHMLGLLGSERVNLTSSGALATQQILQAGVRGNPDVNAVAARKEHALEVLVWNYHDDDLPSPDSPIDLLLSGLPPNAKRGLLEHYRLDATHSNSFAAWQAMGSPQSPTETQYSQLRSAGELQLLNSPAWIVLNHGAAQMKFTLPRQGISLLRLSW